MLPSCGGLSRCRPSSRSDAMQERAQQEKAQQDQAESYQQRLACLSYEWDAVEQKDSEAIELTAEEVSAKDRTGWFKRTRWDEHLQAYPDWKLLAYAIRLPGDDEPQLQRVVQLVEELVEEAVQGLSTLSLETLRWLRSPKAQEPDAAPGMRESQPLPAAPAVPALASIARLFPWHGRQKLAAERLRQYVSSHDSSTTTAKQRKYILRLSQSLICQEVCHQPSNSGLVHFIAALGLYPETGRLRAAAQFSLLRSVIYCARALTVDIFPILVKYFRLTL
ncbi:hypothetical protein AA0111_g5338 [Alternaria arborescens]|uniref:hypothetical protein n=1 Tax=Alternaria arborescens TaxID=156630 RepID=UPI0010753DEE|nr:hypothetical protein AA0111_g5338 [Alternaria arborescens]RYO31055.1 hypothetical protein AA0111_g5338 [Alternaria arborescens]